MRKNLIKNMGGKILNNVINNKIRGKKKKENSNDGKSIKKNLSPKFDKQSHLCLEDAPTLYFTRIRIQSQFWRVKIGYGSFWTKNHGITKILHPDKMFQDKEVEYTKI